MKQEHPQTCDRLFVILYDELHRVAQRELRRNKGATLSPTTLLHETFLSLSQRESAAFCNRATLMSYAARAMRGLVIDYVRRRHAQKRGGELHITSLSSVLPQPWESDTHAGEFSLPLMLENDTQVEKLNDALGALAQMDARLADCVDLRFFCGFSFEEIAQILEVSQRTIRRDWNKARLLLNRLINE